LCVRAPVANARARRQTATTVAAEQVAGGLSCTYPTSNAANVSIAAVVAGRTLNMLDRDSIDVLPCAPLGGTSAPTSSAGALSGGAIAGIVIGVLAAVVLLALALFFVERKRRLDAAEAAAAKVLLILARARGTNAL